MTPKEIDDTILNLTNQSKTLDQGFSLLMQTYQGRLYWQARKISGSHEDANDILQNAFIRIYKALKDFRGESSLYSWMHRIVTNEALTQVTKKNKKINDTVAWEDSMAEADTSSEQDAQKTLDLLQKAIKGLPEVQKTVFDMRYFQELPYAQIAKILGTTEGSLKASYHHAVKKIEKFINPD